MRQYIDTVQDNNGNALYGAVVQVFVLPSGGQASIFSDNGLTPIVGASVTTDATGQFSFYAADGDYTLKFFYNTTLFKTQSPVALLDGIHGTTFTDTGAANAYAVTDSRLEKALRTGLRINVLVSNTNTVASTFAYNALAAKAIQNSDGNALLPNQLRFGGIYLLEYTGSVWQVRGQGSTATFPTVCLVKPTTETRTSVTTLTNDSVLAYAIPVAGSYEFEIGLNIGSGAAGGGCGIAFNVNYSGTFTATSYYHSDVILSTGQLPATAPINATVNVAQVSYAGGVVNNALTDKVIIKGVLVATGTGTLAVSYAQANSSANPLSVGFSSYMKVTQVG